MLRFLLQKLALRFADLERRGVAKMAEIMQMIVEPLQFGKQDPQRFRPRRYLAARGALDRFAIRQGVRDRADARNSFGDDDGAIGIVSFEAVFPCPDA